MKEKRLKTPHHPSKTTNNYREEAKKIIQIIEEIRQKLEDAQRRFDCVTDETLIDSCIYEISALNKKYEYFIRIAKEMGLGKDAFRKIG